jgi:hypothetical protein
MNCLTSRTVEVTEWLEILGHVVLQPRQQFAAGDSDQLDGNAARFVIGVWINVGIAIGEADHRREGPRLGEHAVTGLLGQIGQNLEFGHQSCVDLGVKPAKRPVLVGVLLLIGDDIARKILEQRWFAGEGNLFPGRAGGRQPVCSQSHEQPPPAQERLMP